MAYTEASHPVRYRPYNYLGECLNNTSPNDRLHFSRNNINELRSGFHNPGNYSYQGYTRDDGTGPSQNSYQPGATSSYHQRGEGRRQPNGGRHHSEGYSEHSNFDNVERQEVYPTTNWSDNQPRDYHRKSYGRHRSYHGNEYQCLFSNDSNQRNEYFHDGNSHILSNKVPDSNIYNAKNRHNSYKDPRRAWQQSFDNNFSRHTNSLKPTKSQCQSESLLYESGTHSNTKQTTVPENFRNGNVLISVGNEEIELERYVELAQSSKNASPGEDNTLGNDMGSNVKNLQLYSSNQHPTSPTVVIVLLNNIEKHRASSTDDLHIVPDVNRSPILKHPQDDYFPNNSKETTEQLDKDILLNNYPIGSLSDREGDDPVKDNEINPKVSSNLSFIATVIGIPRHGLHESTSDICATDINVESTENGLLRDNSNIRKESEVIHPYSVIGNETEYEKKSPSNNEPEEAEKCSSTNKEEHVEKRVSSNNVVDKVKKLILVYNERTGMNKLGVKQDSTQKVYIKNPPLNIHANGKSATCLMCFREVPRSNFREHLLFGSIQCNNCSWNTNECKIFNERHSYVYSFYNCSHTSIRWTLNLDQIENNFHERCDFSKFLNDYLDSTIALKFYPPWDEAYKQCEAEIQDFISIGNVVNNIVLTVNTSNQQPMIDMNNNSEQRPLRDRCSVESNDSLKENLEDLLAFKKSSKPCVLLQSDGDDEKDTSLLSAKETYSKSVTVVSSKKSKKSRKKRKNRSAMIFSIKDKPNLKVSSPNTKCNIINENESSDFSEENERLKKDQSLLPEYIKGKDYVITWIMRDHCPQCCAHIKPESVSFNMTSGIVIAQCHECLLYICFRNKSFESLYFSKKVH